MVLNDYVKELKVTNCRNTINVISKKVVLDSDFCIECKFVLER